MSTETKQTTEHETIQLWIEDRDGKPAAVKATHDDDEVGVLRVWFPGQGSGDDLQEITWGEFFKKFEEAKLAFLYEVHTDDGTLSRFSKFVSR